MWIEKNQKGKYIYRESYKDPYTEKKRTVSVTLNSKSNQAKKQAQLELNKKIEHQLSVKSTKKITFAKLQAEWWDIHRKGIRSSSAATYKTGLNYINKHIDGNALARNLDVRYLQNFVNNFPETYQHKTKRNIMMLVNKILEYGVDMEYLTENPTARVILTKPAQTLENFEDISKKYLEKDEMELLLKSYYADKRSKRIGNLAEFMFLTGLRIGEAIALTVDNYNKKNKTIAVTGTLDYISKGYKHATKELPKTPASYRKITLSNRAAKILDEVITENRLRFQEYSEQDYIFVGYTKKVIRHTSFNTSLQNKNSKLKDKKINKHLSSHIFRHTHISMLAEMGVPIKAIMERVGHEDERTTLKIYTHVTESQKIDIIKKMNALGY